MAGSHALRKNTGSQCTYYLQLMLGGVGGQRGKTRIFMQMSAQADARGQKRGWVGVATLFYPIPSPLKRPHTAWEASRRSVPAICAYSGHQHLLEPSLTPCE